ncbi:MAG: SagB family peptide dehydrogenase [Solirubrobacteraceae bacterium]
MVRWDPTPARRYHERTKHTFASVRAAARPLDWSSSPNPFKLYRNLEAVALPRELPGSDVSALEALAAGEQPADREPDLAGLGWILRWGAGVMRSRVFPGGETYHFRAYPSAGALYPLELYLACAPLRDLKGGLYHFHPQELVLRRIRAGDARAALAEAAGEPGLAEVGAVLVVTGIMSRSAWKYGARAYRHVFWDAGTMLANLVALASSARLGPRLLTAFADAEVNALLRIDDERETALALLAIGCASRAPQAGRLEPLELDVEPVARGERYREVVELRAASCLHDANEVRAWRAAATSLARPSGSEGDGAARPRAALSCDRIEAVIRRRGSTREFALRPVPVAQAAAILTRAAGSLPADVPPLNDVYLAAHALEGLTPGAYVFSPPDRFQPTRRGSLRRAAAYACLGQLQGGTSAATVFLMLDLDRALDALGSRGYHAASLDAGMRAGRIYLGAYAQDLGATGLTFYDDEATKLVAPGTRLEPMMSVAIGIDARRPGLRRPGRSDSR